MSILKVSVYQKPLNEGLNLTILKKLAALKSDFLVLPEYFYLDSNIKDDQALLDRSQFAQDWIQKLSDAYHGVIIGGTILRTDESASKSVLRCSTPIVSNGEIIDWYNKRNPVDYDFEKKTSAGGEEGVYILSGHRFAVLNGRDLMQTDEIARLAADGIKIIL
ncbi:MAG: hypothetical protein KDK27_09610, partial [Leptospiraceae bacterium]|nr:hypothetical protein [Leptospiraceae bacterium]